LKKKVFIVVLIFTTALIIISALICGLFVFYERVDLAIIFAVLLILFGIYISNRTADYFSEEISVLKREILSEQKKSEKNLEKLKNRKDTINRITGNMSEGVVMLDGNADIVSCNAAALKIFDIKEEIKGVNIIELLRELKLLEYAHKAVEGVTSDALMNRNGRIYDVRFSPSERGAILLFLDITEKHESEKLRREFSANVSHELKTPLTNISGNAEMLAAGVVADSDKNEFYNRIYSESRRMSTLVNDIMYLSKLDEKSELREKESVNLYEILCEVNNSLSEKAKILRVAIVIQQTDLSVLGDRNMLYELFFNLIENAVKYNREGGKVSVATSENDEKVTVTVSDTGIGIPEESLPFIFDRFYRVDKSRSKKTGGTGLGLAIVKHIAELHNAEISVKSVVGAGTEINIELPLHCR
jgi:two-component system phosphate regulon sensor histidine kinase PhoR